MQRVHDGKSGQAVTELIVALVVFIVLVAGIIQLSVLGLFHTRTMTEARRQAGMKAMLDVSAFAGPDYIADRTVGADQSSYSRDDGFSSGDIGAFQAGIVGYAHPDELDRQRPDNAFGEMQRSSFPHLQFGLVEGDARISTPLMPVVRTLLYRADEVEVEGKAWLTWTKGIY